MNESNFRINVIVKDDQYLRISIVASQAKTTVAKLKRTIEQQIHELHGVNILVSLVEDSQGFVLSNNSVIGDHLRHGDTIYVQNHHQKSGTNMNLPSNLSDMFLTLRYVSGSVIKKLSEVSVQMNPLQVVSQIIHLGFWYSNVEIVSQMCKLLNKILTHENIDHYYRQAHQMQNLLLLRMLNFWFSQVRQSYAAFPQVIEQLLSLLEKLSSHSSYAELLKSHKITKSIMELSKDSQVQTKLKRLAVQIIRNITGKGGLKSHIQSAYIPTALTQSTVDFTNVQEIAQALGSGSQQQKDEALHQLAEQPNLLTQLTVRFDYYWKTTGVFLMRSIQDKQTARTFSTVVKALSSQTTPEKAGQVMQKDIVKRIGNFLLDSHRDAHQAVYNYYTLISKESARRGVFNVEQASQFLNSPHTQFQKITAEALADMSDSKVSPIRFLPSIKNYIKIALKTDDESLSTLLMKILGNLTLDEQCRYQVVNLKGIQVFLKLLELGEKNRNVQLQRICAKGLMNISVSSRQTKARILGLFPNVLQSYYKGRIDQIAGSYLQNILKAPKV